MLLHLAAEAAEEEDAGQSSHHCEPGLDVPSDSASDRCASDGAEAGTTAAAAPAGGGGGSGRAVGTLIHDNPLKNAR